MNRSSTGVQHSFSVFLCGEEDGLQIHIHSTSSVTPVDISSSKDLGRAPFGLALISFISQPIRDGRGEVF